VVSGGKAKLEMVAGGLMVAGGDGGGGIMHGEGGIDGALGAGCAAVISGAIAAGQGAQSVEDASDKSAHVALLVHGYRLYRLCGLARMERRQGFH
jgi:hypothetical protein